MDASEQRKPAAAGLSITTQAADALLVKISGEWKITEPLPCTADVEKALESSKGIRRIAFDTRDLGGWDSGLLTFLIKIFTETRGHVTQWWTGMRSPFTAWPIPFRRLRQR